MLRRRPVAWGWILALPIAALSCAPAEELATPGPAATLEQARELAARIAIVDTHIDVPYRLVEKYEDVGEATDGGDFDYPRAVAGGLDVPFLSIYVPASYQESGGAKAYADELIDLVEGIAQAHPDKFGVARSLDDAREVRGAGKIALALGMENGAPIEDDLANVVHFRDRGIRYITLTHSKDNQICDSSYDSSATWGGLSEFGEQVVAAMNRAGVMIDVSHVSDAAFEQVIGLTKAPVIASHSSCRHYTPGWQRNMSDEMIRALAENGGVIGINFGSDFIDDDYRQARATHRTAVAAYLEEHGIEEDSEEASAYRDEYMAARPVPFADVKDVADHIDHVVELVGVDHVGFGSDYDGVGDSLPTGLKDVSGYPNLIAELLARGYSEEQIEKIASGNFFRVWAAVEALASE